MMFRRLSWSANMLTALAVAVFVTNMAPAPAAAAPTAAAEPNCEALATDPANGIAGNPAIKSATSVIVPAAGRDVSYCKVSLLYGTNPNQNINIVVGLPLSRVDGGSGGVQGAWNGRTQGLGGGAVVPAV
jgi:hypothetical protein